MKFIVVNNRQYGNALKGTKIYYEGRRPKGLSDDGKINFGKNVLEALKGKFGRFQWIITKDKDGIKKLNGIVRVRTSQKTLQLMYNEHLSRNRDIKNDLIRHRFSLLYPSFFKPGTRAAYSPGSLAEILERASVARLSSEDKEALARFLPGFVASESVGTVNMLRASSQIKTMEGLIREITGAIESAKSESWWQTFIKANILVIQQGYIKAIEKMNIAIGTTKFPDFSLVTHDSYLDILEIKKPTTELVRFDPSRGNYFWDPEIAKAVIQVENYIESVSKYSDHVRSYIKDIYGIELKVVRPRGIILAGNARSFTDQKQKDDFRLLCQSAKNITFVTYDELLSRLTNYVEVLKQHSKPVMGQGRRKFKK